MPLVLGDDRLDLRQFKHLMTQRLRIAARKRPAATPALRWFQGNRFGHLFRRHERSLMLGVSFLSALFATGGLAFRPRRFGMRMFTGGRQRRVLRIHAEPPLQVLNPAFIILD